MVPAPQAVRISFEEMLEMASLGAKVLQIRSVSSPSSTACRCTFARTFEEGEARG